MSKCPKGWKEVAFDIASEYLVVGNYNSFAWYAVASYLNEEYKAE